LDAAIFNVNFDEVVRSEDEADRLDLALLIALDFGFFDTGLIVAHDLLL
jgi:hypothetical protein